MEVKSKVTKALIPVAGLGTRFLPASKTVPKEMLPLVDYPILYYVVKEAYLSGIREVVLITGRHKESIEDFFDVSFEVEAKLALDRKEMLLGDLAKLRKEMTFISVRQKEPKGLGHAVLCGRSVIGGDSFCVLLGDEVMKVDHEGNLALAKLIKAYEKNGVSQVGTIQVSKEDVSKYGVVELEEKTRRVKRIVEKPLPEEAPSQEVLPGRYLFTSKIMDYLEKTHPGKNNEIQLTDAMTQLAINEGMEAVVLQNPRFDTGDKLGFLKANVAFALDREEFSAPFLSYLRQVSREKGEE